ncbi:MAG: hypothetical protein HGB26_07450, partial [Desulfobulbaceae bacterium]|nr:hypothetical protein [Desulfobulbaceae bacterium]
LADGKVIAGIHIPYEQIRSNPVRFGETAFSEDSSKLLVVSPYNYDYAIINSFDLATGTITPLLLPSLPPLNPPPAQAYEGWKKSPLYSTRFYRYQGHLYFSCQYDRLQEAWAYNFTLPLKKDGSEDMEHYVMPYLIMVADLGDGKRVLSTSVLNFPEKAVQSGVPPPMDRLESNRVSLVDYVPQANVVVLGCFGSRVLDKQGTRTDLFQTLSLQRELLVQFAESWWLSPGGEVLHPNMPLLLCHERVPIDDNLRSVYISTHELDEKVPSKQQFVLYDLLTGKEVDRIDRHKSYPTYNTLIMSGHCFSPDGRHFTYEQDGPVLPIYKVTLSNKEK